LTSGSLSDYQGVAYTDGTFVINRAQQVPIAIAQYGATFGTPYQVLIYGGSGTGALTKTLSAGTATGCSLSGDTVTTTSAGTCLLTATKARDKNYETSTATIGIYFLIYTPSQPSNSAGSGTSVTLNGATALAIDTTAPPSITSLSTLTISIGGTLTINGSGFGASGLVVKLWRNKTVTPASTTASTITLNVSDIGTSGASTGRITVITVNGQAVSADTLTINP
jgi:hypothetical protein